MAKRNNRKPRTQPVRIRTLQDPDDDWNASNALPARSAAGESAPVDVEAVKAALELGVEINEKIDNLSEQSRDAGMDFFTSVTEGVKEVCDTIEQNQRVTPKQQTALENWNGGVDKWVENDHGDR